MKKARFWAILMTAILSFSTLTNDYMIAYAAEDTETTDASATAEEEEPQPTLEVVEEYSDNVIAEEVAEPPADEQPAADVPAVEPASGAAVGGEEDLIPADDADGAEGGEEDGDLEDDEDLDDFEAEDEAEELDAGNPFNSSPKIEVDGTYDFDYSEISTDAKAAVVSIKSAEVNNHDGYVSLEITTNDAREPVVRITALKNTEQQLNVKTIVTYLHNNKEKDATVVFHITKVTGVEEEPEEETPETKPEQTAYTGKLKWSVEWSTLSVLNEGKVVKRDSANRREGEAVVAQYIIEYPTSIETQRQSRFPRFRIVWDDYEICQNEIHINGKLYGPYKVEYIDVDTGNPIKDPVEREGRFYRDPSDKNAVDYRVITYAEDSDKQIVGWTYLPDQSTDSLKLGEDVNKNVITLKFQQNVDTTYSVKYYYQNFEGGYTEVAPADLTGLAVTSGDEIKVDPAPEAETEYKNVPYKLNATKSTLSMTASPVSDDNVLEVYYDLVASKYKVEIYQQGQNRKYGSNPSYTKTYDCKVGEKLTVKESDYKSYLSRYDKTFGTISYALDKDESTLTIDSAEANTDGTVNNVLKVYLKRTVNNVYYSILYPGQEMPEDGLPRPYERFFPSSYNRFSWPGTAKDLPEGQWYDYDPTGAKIEAYMIDVPWDLINAGLDRHFGTHEGVTITWYAYKIEPNSYETGHCMINGYVSNYAVKMNYNQNRPDGKESATYTDENTVNIGNKYTILGKEGDAAYSLTQGVPGYAFKGWALEANATEVKYDAGQQIDLDNPLTFYGVWERVLPDVLTVKAANGTWDYDGEAHTTAEVASVVCGVVEEGADATDAGSLPEGWTVTITTTADSTITDAGEVPNKIATVTVKNADGEDVTDLFKTINKEDGTLTVNAIPVTVTTGGDEKTYDGEPLTCDEIDITGLIAADKAAISYKTTGTVTDVTGDEGVDNTYTIDWKNVNKDNYEITDELGKLVVREYAGIITVTVKGGSYIYDGEEHTASISIQSAVPMSAIADGGRVNSTGVAATVDGQSLPKGYSLADAKTMSLIDKDEVPGSEVIDNTKVKIVNASGKDVTAKLNIDYVAHEDGAALQIKPTDLYVTTYSNSGVYSGRAVTAGGKMDGVVPRDVGEIKLVVTGRQIEVGQSRNTYRIDWGNAKSANYDVQASRGWLTVYDSFIPTTDDDPKDDPQDNPPTNNDPSDNPPTGDQPTSVVPTTTIPDAPTPLAGVLGASRGIEADDSSVLGQRRAAAEAGVLGARRDAETSDANHMAMYLMLMGITTGVGGAWIAGRRKKRED